MATVRQMKESQAQYSEDRIVQIDQSRRLMDPPVEETELKEDDTLTPDILMELEREKLFLLETIAVQDRVLRKLPLPSKRHLESLDGILIDIYQQFGLSKEDLKERADITSSIQNFLNQSIPDLALRVYGSSLTGFGLKSSDLNMDLVVPEGEIPAHFLIRVYKRLIKCDRYKQVRSNFLTKVPSVLFYSPHGKVHCKISLYCDSAYYTSRLLAIYSKLDPRVRQLATIFRHWAKICQVDDQQKGSLPSYTFGLMTVFFLQQCKPPLLPVLWKDISEEELTTPKTSNDILNMLTDLDLNNQHWVCDNDKSIGQLWIDLLLFFGSSFNIFDNVISIRQKKILLQSEKEWETGHLSVEDPFSTQSNVLSSIKVFDYIYNCLRKSYLYFSSPTNHNDIAVTHGALDYVFRKEKTEQFSDTSKSSDMENILSVHTQEDTDNLVLNTNVNADVSSIETGQPVDKEDIPMYMFEDEEEIYDRDDIDIETIVGQSFLVDDSALMSMVESTHNAEIEVTKDSFKEQEIMGENKILKGLKDTNNSGSRSCSESDLELESPESFPMRKKMLERPRTPENAEYNINFTVDSLTDGKRPSFMCVSCCKEGHLESNCPKEQLPEVKSPVIEQHLKLLSDVISSLPLDFQLSTTEMNVREAVRKSLETCIQELFPDAELNLFGSSKNGFGYHRCDIDICLTLRGKNAEELNLAKMIEALTKKLKKHKSFCNIFHITTARVPIVKFVHKSTRLEGDISLYNTLALQNTKLLYCYSCIDSRVKTLGYAIKAFAKVCDIGDASKGGLSSYAYILLLLHYLQHTQPPVIPVLQELRGEEAKTEFIVDGWNTWFFDDLKALPKVWLGYKRNSQSVGELWLGLFKYYVEEFNFEEEVVTIRQFEPLTKFKKIWSRKCIAIEDPFDLSRNLGAGLTTEMRTYIKSAFINARVLYGTPVSGIPDGFNSLAGYFFDHDVLTEGDKADDKLCSVSGTTGHITKECSGSLVGKDRESEMMKRNGGQRKTEEMIHTEGTGSVSGINENKSNQQGRSAARQGLNVLPTGASFFPQQKPRQDGRKLVLLLEKKKVRKTKRRNMKEKEEQDLRK